MTFLPFGKTIHWKMVLLVPFITLLFSACKEEEQKPEIIPPAFKIHSVEPYQGVPGDTVTITVANQGASVLTAVSLNGKAITPFNVKDSVFQLVMSGKAGYQSITVNYGAKIATKNDFFEIFAFQFQGLGNKTLQVWPKGGARDSIFIKAQNAPKDKSMYSFQEEHVYNGVVTVKQGSGYLAVHRITNSGIILKLVNDFPNIPGFDLRLYLRVGDAEYKLDELQILGSYRLWPGSIENYPENEIILFRGNRTFSTLTSEGFQSHVYLNGIKLKQNYYDSRMPDERGYSAIESFAMPPGIEPGEYELTVFRLDGTTPILPDSTNKIRVSDIYYCPENSSYTQGADIKVFISPDLYIYRCYSCPKTVSLWDAARQVEYVCTIKSTGYANSKVHIIITPPADMPPNAVYTLEMKTQNGYIYKANPDCNGAITITPN